MSDEEKISNDTGNNKQPVLGYSDDVHAEVLEDLIVGNYGYKYRMLEGLVMPPYITPDRYRYSREIKTRANDICYTSFPKSGSTWLSYILVLLTNEGEIPEGQTLRSCLNWVASSFTYPRSPSELEAMPSPRIFKSHMPINMAVGGNPADSPCKHIYIARNPKDVVVSYYHFEKDQKWAGNFNGSWENWLDMFMEGRVQRGDWFDHVLGWWEQHDNPNILFLKFEDLKVNYPSEIKKIADFLEYPLSDGLLETILDKTSFESMRQTRFSNMREIPGLEDFYRKGKIGSWRDQFTADQEKKFDELYARRMQDTGLEFASE